MNKARHAYGDSENLAAALEANKINEYDVLFLDGNTEPKVGWVDAEGTVRIAEGKNQIVRVDALPTADGDENVVYIYNNEGYIWDGTQCVSISKATDLTELETQVTNLETQIATKTDTATVETMIETAIAEGVAVEVVEF